MRFEKWQALGNDYLIVEREELPWELTPARVQRLCDVRIGPGSDGVLLLSPADDSGARRRAADLQPRRLRGRALRERRPRGRALPPQSWLDRRGRVLRAHEGRPGAPAHHRPGHGRDGDRARLTGLFRLPGRPGGRDRHRQRRGRDWAFQHVNVGNPQCVIQAGEELEELDLGADRPGDRELCPVPEPHQRLVHQRRRLDRPRADLRARGGGDALLRARARAARPSPPIWPGRPRRSPSGSTAASSTVEVSDELDVTLTGTAEPVYAAELAPELVRALDDLV